MGTAGIFFHGFNAELHTLYRYIARRLLLCLTLTTSSFLLITIVIDLAENLDTFIDFEATLPLMILYYIYRIPYWLILILPISCLLGSIFALTSLTRHNEIAAMKTIGFSINHILLPVFCCGITVSALAFIFTDYVVPKATSRHNDVNNQIMAQQSSDGSQRHVLIQGIRGQIIFARNYDAKKKYAEDISVEIFENFILSERIVAQHLFWRKPNWVSVDGYRYTFGERTQRATRFDTLVIPGLELTPADFTRQIKLPEEMTYSELKRYISRGNARGEDVIRHRVDLHLKSAVPFACLIIMVLGATIGANTHQTNISNSFGFGILICFGYYSCLKIGQALGWNGLLSPWLSAWFTNMLFVSLTICLIWRTNK